MDIKIAPSILSADFGRLNEEIASVEPYSDFIHIDVMDGHFVPNITIGASVVRCIKTALPLDIHLMIENPEKFVEDFVKAAKEAAASSIPRIIVHSEACRDMVGIFGKIKELRARPGVSIKPKTGVSDIKDILDLVDEVLVMTVEPGFGGQEFMEDMISKIEDLRKLGFDKDISVDGGINAETAKICIKAGANVLVAGNYIFKAKNRIEAIQNLRQ